MYFIFPTWHLLCTVAYPMNKNNNWIDCRANNALFTLLRNSKILDSETFRSRTHDESPTLHLIIACHNLRASRLFLLIYIIFFFTYELHFFIYQLIVRWWRLINILRINHHMPTSPPKASESLRNYKCTSKICARFLLNAASSTTSLTCL